MLDQGTYQAQAFSLSCRPFFATQTADVTTHPAWSTQLRQSHQEIEGNLSVTLFYLYKCALCAYRKLNFHRRN